MAWPGTAIPNFFRSYALPAFLSPHFSLVTPVFSILDTAAGNAEALAGIDSVPSIELTLLVFLVKRYVNEGLKVR
jgi:hypothetical protein